MSRALIELFRHKTWATLRLIEQCRTLSDDHLDAVVPGTYGSIRTTLTHLVDAEGRYVRTITGAYPWEPFVGEAVALDQLAACTEQLAPRWEEMAADADLAEREVETLGGQRLPAWVVLAQVIHHADDHRTHVLSSLGARGLDVPDLDVWAYAEAAGVTAR